MFKFISKKEYETLWEIIDKQNEQIEELIKLTADAQANANHATRCYCDLIELVDNNLQALPPEAIENVRKIRELMKDQG